MDIDGQEAERFDIRLAPNPAATIEQEALDVAGVTLEQIQSYQPMEEGYRQLVGILSKYVNKFDKRDKMYLVGYNNAGFDNNFLRALFQQCGDKYFGSWFYPNCMDLLRSQNEMIKDIHDYVKEVTSEKYIGESRMTNFSINLAADILTEAISPKIKGMMVDLLKKQGWKTE